MSVTLLDDKPVQETCCFWRKAIQLLARQMQVSPSHLVRHFLMQAVAYYANNHREEG